MTYEETKKKYEAAVKAFGRADATLTKAGEAYTEAKIAHNAALPDGFYVESGAELLSGEYPIYVRKDGEWFWHGPYSEGFETPEWLEDTGFDIDIIPITEVKF